MITQYCSILNIKGFYVIRNLGEKGTTGYQMSATFQILNAFTYIVSFNQDTTHIKCEIIVIALIL